MSRRITTLITVAILPMAYLAGCVAETTDEVGELGQGLTVLDAEEGALSLAYRSGDEVIFMEALRGQPSMYVDEPTMPDYEVDARFSAEDGHAFYLRRGGDAWVEPSWADSEIEALPSDGSNEHLFQLATDAAAVMHDDIVAQIGEERAAQVGPEIDAVFSFAEEAAETYDDIAAGYREYLAEEQEGPLLEDEATGDVAYGSKGDGDDNEQFFSEGYYRINLHAKGIYCVWGLCGGDHSATRLDEYTNSWARVRDMCNHGECASGMDRKGRLEKKETLASGQRAEFRLQVCGTHYDWDSSGGGHNCHDDSRLQMNNFVYNELIGGSQYWCADSKTDHWYRPDANGDDDDGYNHPYYCDRDNGSASSCPRSMYGDGVCDCGCRFVSDKNWLNGTHADKDCHP